MKSNTSAEKDAILNHIDRIFKAYLKRDLKEIKELHTEDWAGFQGPSTSIERGIESYMKNAQKSLESFHGSSYELLDTEVQIFGEIGIVYYVAEYKYENPDGQSGTLPLRSVDIYRKIDGHWNQIGSHIGIIPSADDKKWGTDR